MSRLILMAILLSGCAARKPIAVTTHVPRECIKAVELTDKTDCKSKPGEKLGCTGLALTYIKGCETVQVQGGRK